MVDFQSPPDAAPLNQIGQLALLFASRLLRWGCVGAYQNAEPGTAKTARRDAKIAAESDFTATERASDVVGTSFPILPTPIMRSGFQ